MKRVVVASLLGFFMVTLCNTPTPEKLPKRLRLDIPNEFSIAIPNKFEAQIGLPEHFEICLCSQKTALNLVGVATAIVGLLSIHHGLNNYRFFQIFAGGGLGLLGGFIILLSEFLTEPPQNTLNEKDPLLDQIGQSGNFQIE